MTESIDPSELLIGYNKFIAYRASMIIANKKYRNSAAGKASSFRNHKIWCDNHKDDLEYKK